MGWCDAGVNLRKREVRKMLLFLRDFLILFLLSFLYSYLYYIFFFDVPRNLFLIPILEGLYFAFICYFIIWISLRRLKSIELFCFLSWGGAILLSIINIIGGEQSSLTYRVNGMELFVNGQITFLGIIFEFLDPVGFLAFFSTFILLRKRIRSEASGAV